MNIQWLREHVAELSERLARFEQMQKQLPVFYQQACVHIQNQAALSKLTEDYVIHLDRQQKAIDNMAELYQKAYTKLAALESGQS